MTKAKRKRFTMQGSRSESGSLVLTCRQYPWFEVRDPEEHYARICSEAMYLLQRHAGMGEGDYVEWVCSW